MMIVNNSEAIAPNNRFRTYPVWFFCNIEIDNAIPLSRFRSADLTVKVAAHAAAALGEGS
jgi:hypothetical protein